MNRILHNTICGCLILTAFMASCSRPKHFEFGTAVNPDGESVYVDSKGLLFNGERVLPVAGEIHFQRVPDTEWKAELLKMKAGGIDIVSCYVFWNYMETYEGTFDFTGRNNIRKFISECGECGLKVLLRPGPWAHGEWYLGGLPEWSIDKCMADSAHFEVRTNTPGFMASLKLYFDALGAQCKGLMWKDGGPIIGLQVDNESFGPWEYLTEGKRLAIEAGFDLPFYTKTQWPYIEDGVDEGEFLPLEGNYVDGFWNEELTDMPADYRESFLFKNLRCNADPEGDPAKVTVKLDANVDCPIRGLSYPKMMCELGTGMMTSYHRRIFIYDNDIRASVITRIGTGCNMPGYFMYHGGTDPWTPENHFNETRDSKYTTANDLPFRTYDFHAPLGEMGKPTLWYHHLRLINQFLHDWGGELAEMPAEAGHSQVRSAVRSNGKSGFVFVSNYERMGSLGTNNLEFAGQTIPVPEGRSFFFPFGISYKSLNIDWATAQPFCKTSDAIYFAAVEGIDAKLSIDGEVFTPELDRAVDIKGTTVFVMSAAKSLTAFKVDDKVVFSEGIVYKDGDRLLCETWVEGESVPAKQTKKEDPKRTPVMEEGRPMFPAGELGKAASWSIEVPALESPEDWFVEVSYRGDIAQAWSGDTLVEDNFWNGRTMYVRVSDLVDGKCRLDILALPKDYPIYLQKEQREVLASCDGYLCSLDSVRLVHRVRAEI